MSKRSDLRRIASPATVAPRLPCLLTLAVAAVASVAGESMVAWRDPGFEEVNAGRLVATGREPAGWEIQQTGRPAVQERLRVECVKDAGRAHTGAKCVALSIPAETVGFEFVTIGQRVKLDASSDYEASVWVRWPDGPESAPANASATSGHRSAIVSFWARHRDGAGDFAGRDEWLFDNRWHRLTFRFRATDPQEKTLLYVSLLPNQKPADTTVLVDDFELQATPAKAVSDERGPRVGDADFSAQKPGAVAPPWYFANIGGTGIRGEIVAEGRLSSRPAIVPDAPPADGKPPLHFRIAMDRDTTNFESAQLWQHVDLRPGARYTIRARLRWDNFAPDAPAPIVNYGIYHEPTRTWYGPVDQVLEKTAGWREYRFTHIPPAPGPWKLYLQLNGWGNFGRHVTASVDELTCEPSR